MAMLSIGDSECSICGTVLTEANDAADEIVCTTHFIPYDDHPLWQFSDSCMHKDCFLGWPHREEFAALYMLAVRGDQLLKLLNIQEPAEALIDWKQRRHDYFGVLEWDETCEAWACHLTHDYQSFKVLLHAEARHRMFPFETAARQVQTLLGKLAQLRERVEVKANETVVVVDSADLESDHPLKLEQVSWAKARLAELWVSCWGESEAYFEMDSLPKGTFLVAVIDRLGRVEGIARRVRRPHFGDDEK